MKFPNLNIVNEKRELVIPSTSILYLRKQNKGVKNCKEGYYVHLLNGKKIEIDEDFYHQIWNNFFQKGGK